MKNMCCGPRAADIGLFFLRLAVAAIFISKGWDKLTNIDGVIAMFEGLKFPVAAFWAYLVAIVEFVGGIGVLLGVYTKVFGTLLAFNMLVALLVVHTKMPWNSALLPISLFGGAMALMGVGGGKFRLFNNKSECCCPGSRIAAKEPPKM